MTSFHKKFGWPTGDSDSDVPLWVSNEMGWIMSTFALGAIVGAALTGAVADWLGRKKTIQLFAFIFTVGAFFQSLSNVITYLYIGRILGGIGVGGFSTIAPIYMSEISPANMRGAIIAMQQLSITFGIFFASASNMGLQYWEEGWRISYAGNGVFAIAVFFLMFVCVESPRWLVKVGKEDEAIVVLKILHHEEEVDGELQDIIYDEKISQIAHATKWKDLFTEERDMKFRTIVGMCVLGLQQFTGINVTFYFAPIIFSNFMSTQASLGAMMGLCFINFIATAFSLRLIENVGRRKLMIVGAGFMAIFSYGIAIFTSDAVYNGMTILAALIILLNALYVSVFEFSWGPIGWIIPSEIYPLELRGKAVSLSTACNWCCNFLVGRMTPIFIRPSVLDIDGTYAFFGTWCVVLLFFSLLYIPETKGIELEHMDKVFRDFRKNPMAKRVSSIQLTCSTTPSMERSDRSASVVEPQESSHGVEAQESSHVVEPQESFHGGSN